MSSECNDLEAPLSSSLMAWGRKPQSLTMWAPLQGCSMVLPSGYLACLHESDPKDKGQSGSHHVFFDLALQDTCHHFCHLGLVTQINTDHRHRGRCRDGNTRVRGSLGTNWRLATTKRLTANIKIKRKF